MSYRDILVAVDNSTHAERAFAAAQQLCQLFNASLTALYTIPVNTLSPAGTPVARLPNVEHYLDTARENASLTGKKFDQLARSYQTRFRWQQCEGDNTELICVNGRHMDLNVLSQNGQYLQGIDNAVSTLLGLGRPALIIPVVKTGQLSFRRALAGWDGSRPAVRAINDALPLLQLADQVEIITLTEKGKHATITAASNAMICEHMQNHAINAEGTHLPRSADNTGSQLLKHARDSNADILVMGAYGHQTLQKSRIGDVTGSLLRSATIPVLLSH